MHAHEHFYPKTNVPRMEARNVHQGTKKLKALGFVNEKFQS